MNMKILGPGFLNCHTLERQTARPSTSSASTPRSRR